MFYFIPIERLQERYTEQMYRWVCSALEARGIAYRVIEGKQLAARTEAGQFLNWSSTINYKAHQIKEIAHKFYNNEIKNGDVFFIADVWFPGIEALAYMRDMLQLNVKVYAIQHAGPFDETDLTHKMLAWGAYQEASWYSFMDGIFVGSELLKSKITEGLKRASLPTSLAARIHVTGQVWDEKDVIATAKTADYISKDSRPIIAWPHRISPDKNINQFYEIASFFKQEEARFLICSGRFGQQYETLLQNVDFEVLSKPVYYAMLRRASALLSTAFHENYGYTIREATALGTPIVCPRRAVYPEMILSDANLYGTTEEAVLLLRTALRGELQAARLKKLRGIAAMLDIMEV